MGPLSYMKSVVDRNVVMRLIPVLICVLIMKTLVLIMPRTALTQCALTQCVEEARRISLRLFCFTRRLLDIRQYNVR
jgi:hypothetical protein